MTSGSVKTFRFRCRYGGCLVGAFVVLSALAGCGKHGKAAPTGGSDVPPSKMKLARNVNLAQAEQRPLTTNVETVGYLEAEFATDIASSVSGIVDGIHFREGQWVKKGELLATLDQKKYKAAAELARANVKSAEANLELAKDKRDRAEAGGIGVSQEDRAAARFTLAKSEADLSSAKAARDLAERDLENSQVRAPYDGQINQRRVTVGSYVNTGPNDKNVIATIADLSRIRLVAYVPEKATPIVVDLMNKKKEAFLEFTLVPFPRHTFRGRIFYLSTTASPDTHMYECKADVDTAHLDVVLKPGYTATIKLPLKGNPHACVVPEVSVRASEKGFVAFKAERRVGRDGKPELDRDGQPVWVAKSVVLELGYRTPGWVEVLKGLHPGDWIVKKGAETLEDGTPISIPPEQLRALSAEIAHAGQPQKLKTATP
jgi:multidrug efflux system membrane fusion protein